MSKVENHLTQFVIQKIWTLGGYAYRQNAGSAFVKEKGGERRVRMGVSGISDVVGALRGRPLYVEVKSPNGVQRASQVAFEKRISARGVGGLYCVVRCPQDLDDKLRQWGLLDV